jgi:hypothetical protein
VTREVGRLLHYFVIDGKTSAVPAAAYRYKKSRHMCHQPSLIYTRKIDMQGTSNVQNDDGVGRADLIISELTHCNVSAH